MTPIGELELRGACAKHSLRIYAPPGAQAPPCPGCERAAGRQKLSRAYKHNLRHDLRWKERPTDDA
jgi:hypothetical protein